LSASIHFSATGAEGEEKSGPTRHPTQHSGRTSPSNWRIRVPVPGGPRPDLRRAEPQRNIHPPPVGQNSHQAPQARGRSSTISTRKRHIHIPPDTPRIPEVAARFWPSSGLRSNKVRPAALNTESHSSVPLPRWDPQTSSCWRRWRPQPGDQHQDLREHLQRPRDLGHLERHVTAMADDLGDRF